MIELLNRRRAAMSIKPSGDGWEEVTLKYTEGDSFKLLGETFSYDATTGVYSSENTITPSVIEFTLIKPEGVTIPSATVLAGGGDTTKNEIWFSNSAFINVRFQNTAVRNLRAGLVTDATITLGPDNDVYYNNAYLDDYPGTMLFKYFNGRDGSSHVGVNIINKIRVKK